MTADAYINNIDDMIVGVPYNMFVWTMVNLDKVRATGIDLTLAADMALAKDHKLEWNVNYSYQRSKPLTDRTSAEYGKQVAYIPLNSGGGSVAYSNPWVDIVVKAVGVSSRYATNSNLPDTRIDGYVEAGVSLRRSLMLFSHRWEASFDIDNIFNKQYQVIARYPMPGLVAADTEISTITKKKTVRNRMNKFISRLLVAALPLSFAACSDDDGPDHEIETVTVSNGAFIVNSGNLRNNIPGSLTFIDYAMQVRYRRMCSRLPMAACSAIPLRMQ